MLEPQHDYIIDGAAGAISVAFRQQRLNSFSEVIEWTHQLPYGRNLDRADYMLIFTEGCGTCSTKHAALAALCHENGIEAQHQVAICQLDTDLDPNVASFLDALGVDFFPEAHCYLRYADRNIDVTFPDQPPTLKTKVLQSFPIEPEQIGHHKLALHHEYLRGWLQDTGLDKRLAFDEVWRLREAWIASLSEK